VTLKQKYPTGDAMMSSDDSTGMSAEEMRAQLLEHLEARGLSVNDGYGPPDTHHQRYFYTSNAMPVLEIVDFFASGRNDDNLWALEICRIRKVGLRMGEGAGSLAEKWHVDGWEVYARALRPKRSYDDIDSVDVVNKF
jgi:hypothetical protein